MAIGNIDLSQEIENWKSAVRGKDVRSANVAAFEKIQGTVNDTVQNVNQAAEEVVSASDKAQQAIDSIQEAIITTTQSYISICHRHTRNQLRQSHRHQTSNGNGRLGRAGSGYGDWRGQHTGDDDGGAAAGYKITVSHD